MSSGLQSHDIKAFSLPTGACHFSSSSQQVSTAGRGKSKHLRLPRKLLPGFLQDLLAPPRQVSSYCPHHAQLLPHPLNQVQLSLLHRKHAEATENKSTKQVFVPHMTGRHFPTVNKHFCYAGPWCKLIHFIECTSNGWWKPYLRFEGWTVFPFGTSVSLQCLPFFLESFGWITSPLSNMRCRR